MVTHFMKHNLYQALYHAANASRLFKTDAIELCAILYLSCHMKRTPVCNLI